MKTKKPIKKCDRLSLWHAIKKATKDISLESLKPDCKYFKGYKPCIFAKKERFLDCWNCTEHYEPYNKRILLIKQGEIGDVIRTTPLVKSLKEKYPQSRITWLVEGKAEQMILNNKYIDEVVIYSPSQLLRFMVEEFDLLICLDKDIASTTIASLVPAKQKVGFGFSKQGFVIPFNEDADYKYLIGASDTLNCLNKKSYLQQIYDIVGLEYKSNQYLLDLPKQSDDAYKHFVKINGLYGNIIIGFNPGCGFKLRTRLWPLDYYAELGKKILKNNPEAKIVLLGGKLEEESNNLLYEKLTKDLSDAEKCRVVHAGNKQNLLQFCGMIEACDILVTSVTMALHIAIALKKRVVVMMGPIVKSEIDTFGLGPILISKQHDCLGCFKDSCDIKPSCMESISPNRVYAAINKHIKVLKNE